MKFIWSLTLILIPLLTNAFEHNYTSSSMAARHGGQVVTSDEAEAHFEAIRKNNTLKIYIYRTDLQQDNSQFELSANFQARTSKTPQSLPLQKKDSYYEGMVSLKKTEPFDLYVSVKNRKTLKEDLLKFSF